MVFVKFPLFHATVRLNQECSAEKKVWERIKNSHSETAPNSF